MRRSRIAALWAVGALGATACGSSPGGTDSGAADSGADVATAADSAGGTCTARVVIGFYSDPDCTMQVGMRAYDTSQSCFSWTSAGSSAGENSATRFQCYRDRLCYTQVPNTLDCVPTSRGQTDKQARTDQCLHEPDGTLYSRVLSGTASCPVAPAGFECPSSAAMMGTPGIAACTNAP